MESGNFASKEAASDTELTSDDKKLEKLLKEKVRLEDGTYDYVFVKKIADFSQMPYWRCNVCDVSVGGTLEKHVVGKKHQSGMKLTVHPTVYWGKAATRKLTMGDLKLAPGEPVPPGFEDEVRGVTEIQASLDAYHSGPLIGLEYLIELAGYEDEREPQYICLLCDKRGDPRTVMAHLVSFNHRMTYLQTHFPTVYRLVSPYNTKQYRRNVQNTVTTICEAIEKKFGRMTPQSADRETFERKKKDYIDNTMKDIHPSERSGETFEHLVDKEAILNTPKVDVLAEIKKVNEEQMKIRQYRRSGPRDSKKDPSPPVVAMPVVKTKSKNDRGRSLSSISSISSSSLSSPHSHGSRSRSRSKSNASKYSKRRYGDYRRSHSKSRSPYRRYYRTSRSYSHSPPRYRRGDPYSGPPVYNNTRLPWQRPEYGKRGGYNDRRVDRRNDMKNNRYEEFRKQCITLEIEMDKVLEQHEKNPEKHPMYPEEWKKFWKRRYKELQAENKDPTKHDFKPEWIDFWNKRMKEMHDGELKSKKDAIRKRLNLPEEPAPISFKIMGKRKTGSDDSDTKEHSKKIDLPTTSDDVIVIDDSKDDDIIRERKRSHSPWESETRERERPMKSDYSREYYKPRYREAVREPEYKRTANLSPKFQKEPEEEINIVAILRLLTALEEKLGSLGPRVIEMLSQALALEKAVANSSETLLDNDVNCVFFETVKEKLKGQLLAGMVELSAEKTFKNAIQKIASLLHFASERKRESEKKQQVKNLEPVKIPGIGTIDKPAIAKQIATALIAQGKTDVTQVELEQLINAVVGMAQASQSTGKPVSTAAFIQQLSNPTPAATEISSLMHTASISTPKTDLMSNALQILQSKSECASSFKSQNTMEGLSDSDLKTLLQNFKDLSTDEQHGLITYLKKLEAREPDRVERLRKFVKLGPNASDTSEKAYTSGRISPFSNREAGVNPSSDESEKKRNAPAQKKLHIDSDEDDDYSFEDVFRAASKNVKEKQMQEERTKLMDNPKPVDKPKDMGINFNDAKMLIANLMGQLGNVNKSQTGLNLLGLGTAVQSSITSNVTNTLSCSSGSGDNSNSSNIPVAANTKLGPNTTMTVKNPAETSIISYPPNSVNPNPNQNMQGYGYNFPQNRAYNAPYDPNYNQAYPGNPAVGFNNPNLNYNQPKVDYNNYPNDQRIVQDYNNTSFPGGHNVGPRAPYRPGQQPYQTYDPRQNYY